MKKRMEQVLQANVKVGHIGNLERLKQPNIDPKEATTSHSEEQHELEDITKNIKPKTIQATKNHLSKLQRIKTK
jgi:hypothetical protein